MFSVNYIEDKNTISKVDMSVKYVLNFSISMIVFFILITSTLCFAQNGNNTEAESPLPPELKTLFEKVNEANENLEHLTAGVNYQRAIPLLGDSEDSTGYFAFIPPDKIYLKLDEPRNEELVSDGERWFVADHNARQVEIYAADKDRAVAESAFLKIGYGSDMTSLAEEYNIYLVEHGKVEKQDVEQDGGSEEEVEEKLEFWRLRFEPKDTQTHAQYEQMEVKITDRFFLPETIILHESDGEILHTFKLHNIDLDAEIAPDIFEYEPPRGYSIITP